jgi:hypothetical protein
MAHQSSKRGVRSDSQKRSRSRYDFGPIPATSQVEGAFGRQVEESDPSQPEPDRESEDGER